MFIYKITNQINKKCYIGSTKDPKKRWQQHKNSSIWESCPSYNYPLQKAMRKYGIDNFSFEIILENLTEEEVAEKERKMIEKYNSLTNTGWGYNQTLETECALRDKQFSTLGTRCALVDINNNILQTFISYHDASLKIFGDDSKFSNIRRVCKGEANSLLNYIFRDLDENKKVIVPQNKTRKRKTAVYGININNCNDIVYYESISEAARQEGIARSSIQKCIAGSSRYSSVGKRKWYKEEVD